MSGRLLIIGDSYMNLVYDIDPSLKSKNINYGNKYSFLAAGMGAKSAITFGLLGGDCVFVTKLGHDTNGKKLLKHFTDCGIDTRYVSMESELQTGLILTETGASAPIYKCIEGAMSTLSIQDVEDGLSSYPDMFLLNFNFDEQFSYNIAKMMQQQNVKMTVNASKDAAAFPYEDFDNIEILVFDTDFLFEKTAIEPRDFDKTVRAMIALASKIHARYYVLKQGNRGCFVYDGSYYEFVPIPGLIGDVPVEHTEAFTAGMLSEYLATGNILRACRVGNIVSLLCETNCGGLIYSPNRAEIKQYVTENKIDLDRA